MDRQIGEAAGCIWQYLAQHGAATLPQVQRGTTLPERLVHGCDRSIPKIPQVAITMDYRYPAWAGATISWSRSVSRPAVPIITLTGITVSDSAYWPFPPVDNHLLST
jgi:hypothetical protein